jgi:hypothetical protein
LNWDSTANSQETTKSEVVGQKHTNIPYKRYIENKSRVTINGKRYRLGNINHPFHLVYKTKGMEAAFEAMNLVPNRLEEIKYTVQKLFDEVRKGQVYIIINPAFPGWCKVGMAVDAEDRLKQYQTSSPYRDYELIATYDTSDRRKAEKFAHDLLEKKHERRGEWFYIQHPVATAILELPMREHL